MENNSSDLGFWIIISLTSLIAIAGFVIAIKMIKYNKAVMKYQKQHKKELNAYFQGFFQHFYGLPIANGINTRCYWCTDKIVFEANGSTYNLPLDNLLSVDVKTDVEIQKQYVSSAGKAIAGGAVFGPIGALIGGRAKEKTIKQATEYLIFTYLSKDGKEVKYVALKVLDYSSSHPYDFVKQFNKMPRKGNATFDL